MLQVQPTKQALHLQANTTNGSWWIRSSPTYKRGAPSPSKYHQRQLVDRSSPTYKAAPTPLRKYHQRQLVDGFKSNLRNRSLHLPANTTNGSWWMLQVQPTKQRQLHSANTTNGSWWYLAGYGVPV